MKRSLTAVITAAALAAALTGCSSGGGGASDDPNAEVAFWSFTGIAAKDGVAEYLKKAPDAKVKLTEVGSTTETATALTAALAGGKVPDLVMIQNDDLPQFVANSSNFLDLRTLGGDDIAADYLPWASSAATADDGSVVGIPTDVGGLGFAYRADLFEQAGLPTEPAEVAAMWKDWDSFIAMGKQYTEKTGKPFVDNIETSVFFATVNQVSEKYYSPEGDLVYDKNPQVEDAFQVAVDAHDAGISAGIAAFSSGWSPGRANGAFAVTVAPSWILKGIKTDAPDTAGNWRIASVPGVGGNWGGSVIAIPKRAAHPQAAYNYIKTMMSAEGQQEHFTKTGTFPAAAGAVESADVLAYKDEFFGDSEIGKVMSESVTKFPSFYNGPDTTPINAALLNTLVELEAGNVTSDKAWSTALSPPTRRPAAPRAGPPHRRRYPLSTATRSRTRTQPDPGSDRSAPRKPAKNTTRQIRYALSERIAPYAYVAPFFVIFIVFGLFPLVFTFYVSLFDWNPIGDQTFVGLQNFQTLFADDRFWNALLNTFAIFLISTIPQLLLALLLAHLLNHARLRFANFFRMALLVPYITSVAATAIVFAQIFDRNFGLINWVLGLVGLPSVNFMATNHGSWILISAMVMWRWFGYNTLLYLAGLQALPREMFEAAAVDGASSWQQFRHLTIPALRPIIVFTVVMSTIGGLQIFTEPLLAAPESGLTCGAGRQCQTLALFLYEQGFGQFKFGYGSAIGVVLFVIVVVVALLNFFLSTRTRKAG